MRIQHKPDPILLQMTYLLPLILILQDYQIMCLLSTILLNHLFLLQQIRARNVCSFLGMSGVPNLGSAGQTLIRTSFVFQDGIITTEG